MGQRPQAAGIPVVSILYGKKAREDLFDDYLADAYVASVKSRLAASQTGATPADPAAVVTTTTVEYGADDCDPADVLDEVRTPALWGAHRLVILKGAEGLLAPPAESRARCEVYLERIASLASASRSPGRLVLVARGLEVHRGAPVTKLKAASALIGAVRKAGGLISCIPPYENALKRTLAQRAAAAGVKLDPQAAATLIEMVGTDQMALQEELDKLLTAADQRTISVADVETLAARRPRATVFSLADSVLEKDASASLRQLDELRRTPATRSAPALLAGLANGFRRILSAARLVHGGKSPRAAASAVGVPRFFQDAFVARLGKWTPEALEALLRRTLQCDVEIKTGSLREQIALETFVCDACEGRLETSQTVGRWIYEV